MMRRIPKLIALPWRRAERIARDVEDELAFHLDMRARELAAASGLPIDAARARAERELGDLPSIRRTLVAIDRGHDRAVHRERWFAEIGQDVRYALRQFVAHRAFALVAILTLALGIGANTAIFSVVNRLLLDPFPDGVGDRLVEVRLTEAKQKFTIQATVPQLVAWRRDARSFDGIEGMMISSYILTGEEAPETIEGEQISSTLLSFLRLSPAAGRGFTADETKPGAPRVAMLGYGLWQRRFGGRAEAIGRTITLDGSPFTIVGVLPAAVRLPGIISSTTAVALPLVVDTLLDATELVGVQVFARVRRGVAIDAARRELAAIDAQPRALSGGSLRWVVEVTSLAEQVGHGMRTTLLAMLAAVGVILLIACVNVANLLLARATARERELAVRVALGAGRWRIVRQLLVESVLLSFAGAAVGIAFGMAGVELIRAMRPSELDVLVAVRLDSAVLAFTLVLSMLTGIAFGLAPALHAVRAATGDTLRQGGARGATAKGRRFRSVLVGAEVALSVLLLVAAGLLARSVVRLQQTDPGFRTAGLLSFRLGLPVSRYPSDTARLAFAEEVLKRARRIPGVATATLAATVPPHSELLFGRLSVEGRDNLASGPMTFSQNAVAPDYFATLGIALREGRTFSDRPRGDGGELIVSRSTALRIWPSERAIGQRVRFGKDAPWATVVGVVDDVRAASPLTRSEPYPQLYVSARQVFPYPMIIVRASGDPLTLVPALRAEVRALDSELPIESVATVEALITKSLARPRFVLALFGAFAALALALAMIGLYGVISYTVAQRTREMGIRIALGAHPERVRQLVIADGMRPALVGVVLGLVGAAGLARFIASLLYGLSPYDVATYATVAATLSAVALVACIVPARRAARVDPIAAIRTE